MERAYKRAKMNQARRGKRAASSYPLGRKKQRAVTTLANLRTGGYVGLEKKFFDSSFTQHGDALGHGLAVQLIESNSFSPPSSTNGALFCPKVGSNQSNRDGRVAQIHSVAISGYVQSVPGGPSNANTISRNIKVYIALVLDTQANGGAFTGSDVFDAISASSADMIHPYRNLSNIQRFKVLASKRVTIVRDMEVVATATGSQVHATKGWQDFSLYHRFSKPLSVHFKGDTGDLPDISDNNISVIAFLEENTAGQDVTTMGGKCRVRFTG